MARDVRVILIKLADRLHNMRTWIPMAPEKRKRHRQGNPGKSTPPSPSSGAEQRIPGAADLGFRYSYPTRYRVLAKAVKTARGNRRAIVEKVLKRSNTS